MGENTATASDAETDEGKYRCEACGRTFETHEALVEHMCDVGQVG